jgi:phosphoglycerate dehydrogenase-like enzyme
MGVGMAGKTLGLLGLGRLGKRMVEYAKAFEMPVIAWSQNLSEERCREVGVTRVDKNELLRTSDFITIHLVLSSRTRDLIGAREFALMKPTAILVNTSRGPIINEPALLDALRTKRILRMALDVYDVEPLPKNHPILAFDNAVLAPHLGYVNDRNYRTFYPQEAEAVLAFLNGAPVRAINPAVPAASGTR